MLELGGYVVEGAERLVSCDEFGVKNVQWHLIVLPEAVPAVVAQFAAQATSSMERMRETHAKIRVIRTESVHPTWTAIRTVALESLPLSSATAKQHRSTAVIVQRSERCSVKSR